MELIRRRLVNDMSGPSFSFIGDNCMIHMLIPVFLRARWNQVHGQEQ